MQVAVGSWPVGYEPAQYRRNFSRVSIAPLTLVYGDQPPQRSERRPDYTWYTPNARVQMPVRSTAWDATVVVSQVPPSLWQQQIWRAWNSEQARVQPLANLAPLTLVYGDQPPLLAKSWQALRQYETPYWSVRPATAAWNVPAPVTGDDPPPKVLPWYTFSNWFEITWASQHSSHVTFGSVEEPAVVPELDDSAGSGRYRKRKQHENLPFSPEDYERSFDKPKEAAKAAVKAESTHEPVEPLSPVDREIQGYLMDMGLIDPSIVQRIIEENERIDRRRRQNFAAIALLLLD